MTRRLKRPCSGGRLEDLAEAADDAAAAAGFFAVLDALAPVELAPLLLPLLLSLL